MALGAPTDPTPTPAQLQLLSLFLSLSPSFAHYLAYLDI